MAVPSFTPGDAYRLAWETLMVLVVFYIAVGVALHWRARRLVRVTRYEPPEGISPAAAAFLNDGGEYERPFAAALVSLAAKGYVQILQTPVWVTLEKLKAADSRLPPEESIVFSSIFPSDDINTYSFSGGDSDRLFAAYKFFRTTLSEIMTAELVSDHEMIWTFGLSFSLLVLVLLAISMPEFGNNLQWGSIAFMCILIFFGGTCFIAALRVWPATLLKLRSFFPGSRRPKSPLTWNDGIPFLLTVYAFAGFMFLAVLASTRFALVAAGACAINVFARYFLNAPTSSGRKALAELQAFREFLSRADADRLDHENEPGKTPQTLEPNIAFAVALGVEHGWGEEFAGNLLELIQVNQAYSPPGEFPVSDNRPTDLDLFGRNK
jgi:hypothetical protein